jgi:hypothetical protein
MVAIHRVETIYIANIFIWCVINKIVRYQSGNQKRLNTFVYYLYVIEINILDQFKKKYLDTIVFSVCVIIFLST